MRVFNKESLSDSFVDNDDCDEGLLLCCVVGLADGLTKLIDFLLKHLFSHGITNSVSVDDEVLWEIFMTISEATKCSLNGLLELFVDNLLSLALDNAVRVVLTALFVDTGTETDN